MSDVLLALESSCDETAAAVITRDLQVLSNVVASQSHLHEVYGGVVPEIASRAHVQCLLPVVDEAVKSAGVSLQDLSGIAVTTEPGLVGSLLVGLTAAKALALALDLPLIPVNHIEGHLYACRMTGGPEVFPAIGLVVSGGHTNLYDCHSSTQFELIGSTIDDAAGEAFDKVAQILGLPYPGGPSIDKVSQTGNPFAFSFPRSFLNDARLAFSFSGLKTAVLYTARGIPGSKEGPAPELTAERIADIAASFQNAVIDVLVAKVQQAMRQRGRNSLCVGGGVAANSLLRQKLSQLSAETGVRITIAPRELCTDNAAMAGMAWELLESGRIGDLGIDVTPGLVRHQPD